MEMKHVLITGCSNKGIGSALAQAFSSHPDIHVMATARKLSAMSDLSSTPNITLLELDVTSASSLAAAIPIVEKQTGGKLDYLLHYAGCGYTLPYLDSDIETCKKMFDVNVWGPMRVTQAFAPLLVDAKGTVVIAGSTAELLGVPFQGAYCASKSALRIMSDALRREGKPLGVRVLHVTTGNIESNWFGNVPVFELPTTSFYQSIAKQIEVRAQGKQDVKWTKADVYADRVVADILAGKEGRVYRGVTASLFRFVVAWVPGWVLDQLSVKGTGLDVLGQQSGAK